MTITQQLLKNKFEYDTTGNFIRKTSGKMVICNESVKKRYLRISIQNKSYVLHRMIFLFHHGYLPKTVDHIDGNRLNNRIDNLRDVTQSQNCINRKHHKNSSSPYKNVYWHAQNKKWVVTFSVNGKKRNFGYYDDIELADLVATEARDKYHKEYARHM